MSNYSGIIEYKPEELYIKVKACTPIIEIEKKLEEYNQELAEKRPQRNQYGRQVSRAKRFSYAGLKVTATLQAFSKLGLPVSAEAFEANPNYALSVRPIFQNKNT